MSKKPKTARAESLMRWADDIDQSEEQFRGHLETGLYAPYQDEAMAALISGFNCTTIIPTVFIAAELLDLDPKIYMFGGFTDIEKRDKKDKPLWFSPHYALTVDVGWKDRWLLDPRWDRMGPIREWRDEYLHIHKRKEFTGARRKYQTIEEITEQEFAQLMAWLQSPQGALDMLTAGQKVTTRVTGMGHYYAALMAYYQPEENQLKTRLYLPQEGITNRAAICKMQLDKEGTIGKTELNLFYTEDALWTRLIGETAVAHIDFKRLQETIKEIEEVMEIKDFQRIGPQFARLSQAQQKRLLQVASEHRKTLDEDEQEKLETRIAVRTLYETKNQDKEYVEPRWQRAQSSKEKAKRAMKVIDEENKDFKERHEKRWLKGIKRTKEEEERTNELSKAVRKARKRINNTLNFLIGHEQEFHRTRDKIIFGRRFKGKKPKEIIKEAEGLDSLIGYLAMLTDFRDFAKKEELMRLTAYQDDIAKKVQARFTA